MRAFMMQILGVRFELGVKLALRWEWRSLDLFEIRSKNGKEPSLPPGGPGLLRCAIWRYRKPVIAEITPLELCRQSDAQRRASIIPSVTWSPPGHQAIPGGPGCCFGCGWFTPSRMMICSTFSKVQSPKWPSRGKGGARCAEFPWLFVAGCWGSCRSECTYDVHYILFYYMIY